MSALNGNTTPLRVAVAGGSIGGLCAGVALNGAGFNVQVYERNAGPMDTRSEARSPEQYLRQQELSIACGAPGLGSHVRTGAKGT